MEKEKQAGESGKNGETRGTVERKERENLRPCVFTSRPPSATGLPLFPLSALLFSLFSLCLLFSAPWWSRHFTYSCKTHTSMCPSVYKESLRDIAAFYLGRFDSNGALLERKWDTQLFGCISYSSSCFSFLKVLSFFRFFSRFTSVHVQLCTVKRNKKSIWCKACVTSWVFGWNGEEELKSCKKMLLSGFLATKKFGHTQDHLTWCFVCLLWCYLWFQLLILKNFTQCFVSSHSK